MLTIRLGLGGSDVKLLAANMFCCMVSVITLVSPASSGSDVICEHVDQYGNISFAEEKKRLNPVIERLRLDKDAIAYVVAHAGRISCSGEARTRANRTKRYLVQTGRLNGDRIKIIDSGYHEEVLVDLYVAPPNAPPLTAQFLAELDNQLPRERRVILTRCKGRIYMKRR